MLLTWVILLGVLVFGLLIVWLTSKIFLSQAAVPVQFTDLGEGDSQLGGGMDLEAPSDEELGLESDLDEPMVAETLAAIADAVGTKAAMLDDPRLTGHSRSGGRGDGRLAGGGGTGTGISRHWEVRFLKGNTLETYARQLDFFGIELGVLQPGNKVVYAYNLTKARPDSRTGPADAEKRYYLTWRSGELQQADRELLARAGIQAQDRIILKFLPPAIEGRLAQLEKARGGARADSIRRTRFGIRSDGAGFAFFIAEQTYRD